MPRHVGRVLPHEVAHVQRFPKQLGGRAVYGVQRQGFGGSFVGWQRYGIEKRKLSSSSAHAGLAADAKRVIDCTLRSCNWRHYVGEIVEQCSKVLTVRKILSFTYEKRVESH